MARVIKFQVSTAFFPEMPKNVVTNTLYFRNNSLLADTSVPLAGTDVGTLADDLAAIYDSALTPVGSKRITVKAYDVEGAPPHDPLVTSTKNPAATLTSPSMPSEVALCLSFRGGLRPWQRGRIYLAPWLMGMGAADRPSAAQRTQALNLADSFSSLGGANIDWVVWSHNRHSAIQVNYAWVDDAWDTQRRRGLAPTTRTSKTVSG